MSLISILLAGHARCHLHMRHLRCRRVDIHHRWTARSHVRGVGVRLRAPLVRWHVGDTALIGLPAISLLRWVRHLLSELLGWKASTSTTTCLHGIAASPRSPRNTMVAHVAMGRLR
jgi:hypothetical protein